MTQTMKTLKIEQPIIPIIGILLFMAFFSEGSSFGQQIPNFSQYNMNHYLVNPAATGTTDQIPVSASYRKMWAGMNNTPSVEYLSGHMKLTPDMGVGARIFNFQ